MKTRSGRIIIVSALLAVVAILLIISVTSSDTNPTRVVKGGVEKVTPPPGGILRPQSEVSVDLVDGYVGRLYIDGQVVPDDQIESVVALGQYTFRPGPGKIIESFRTGAHTARVVFWPSTADEPEVPEEFTWDFRVTS